MDAIQKPLKYATLGLLSPTSAPKPPPIAQPAPMPDPEAVAAAKKRAAINASSQTGRDSTILTSSTDKLGG